MDAIFGVIDSLGVRFEHYCYNIERLKNDKGWFCHGGTCLTDGDEAWDFIIYDEDIEWKEFID